MLINADEIADLVIAQYSRLPKKGKPLTRSNGVKEWTVLAGVVIFNKISNSWQCVSLATGVKAMPESALAHSEGKILHDCHAEILAIRAFNYYCVQTGIDHIGATCLYVCTPPCGDASMSLVNSNGGEEWTRDPAPEPGTLIRGRAHFNCLGFVRTKPGRADSNITMSKSCSDKLCLRQSRGLLLSPVLHSFGTTIYLDTLVCPSSNPEDFERAFSRWSPKTRFQCLNTTAEFPDFHPLDGAPSPCSIIWTPFSYEVVANGIIQGSKTRKSSVVSRSGLTAAITSKGANMDGIDRYYDLKKHSKWPPGWIRTCKDDFDV